MMNFLIIVAAILVAEVIAAVIAVWLVCSEPVLKWYCALERKMIKKMEDEMEKVYEED